jgi:hypothetical protein
MSVWGYALIVALLAAAGFVAFRMRTGIRQLRRYWGEMLVACPETGRTVAIRPAAANAAMSAMIGRQHVELKQCSRWPERSGCAQECVGQIQEDPESHTVWTIASKWFEGKTCHYCQRPIAKFNHFNHAPGLLDHRGQTIEWKEVPAKKLPQVLATSLPVCWNCHITESFRRMHPDLVTERPWHN